MQDANAIIELFDANDIRLDNWEGFHRYGEEDSGKFYVQLNFHEGFYIRRQDGSILHGEQGDWLILDAFDPTFRDIIRRR